MLLGARTLLGAPGIATGSKNGGKGLCSVTVFLALLEIHVFLPDLRTTFHKHTIISHPFRATRIHASVFMLRLTCLSWNRFMLKLPITRLGFSHLLALPAHHPVPAHHGEPQPPRGVNATWHEIDQRAAVKIQFTSATKLIRNPFHNPMSYRI